MTKIGSVVHIYTWGFLKITIPLFLLFFLLELCASASLTGVVIMSQNFHLIDNHGKQPPYKHPHHHRAAVRTH